MGRHVELYGVTVLLTTQTSRARALTGQTAAPVQIFTRRIVPGGEMWSNRRPLDASQRSVPAHPTRAVT